MLICCSQVQDDRPGKVAKFENESAQKEKKSYSESYFSICVWRDLWLDVASASRKGSRSLCLIHKKNPG